MFDVAYGLSTDTDRRFSGEALLRPLLNQGLSSLSRETYEKKFYVSFW